MNITINEIKNVYKQYKDPSFAKKIVLIQSGFYILTLLQ